MKNCTPLWREAHLQVKMRKAHQVQSTFGSWVSKSARRCGAKHMSKSKCTKTPQRRTICGSCDVEKVHAVVARSTFPSQNVQTLGVNGPLLEVQMSKKCTPLWREAHFQVKMLKKTPGVRTTFGGSDVASLRFTSIHYITLNYTPLQYIHYTTLHNTTTYYNYNYTPLHSTTLHYTKLHYATRTLHYITLHYTTLHYATLHYTTFRFTTLHYTPLHYTTTTPTTTQLHSTTRNYTTLHYIRLNDTAPQIDR